MSEISKKTIAFAIIIVFVLILCAIFTGIGGNAATAGLIIFSLMARNCYQICSKT